MATSSKTTSETIPVPISKAKLRRVAAAAKGRRRTDRELVEEALEYYLVGQRIPERLTPAEAAAADDGLRQIERGEGIPLRDALRELDDHHFATGKKRA